MGSSTLRTGLAALLALSLAACRNPQREALRELQRRGIEPSGPALLAAVETGDAEPARLLLQARVYVGQRDTAGNPPLHVAIDRGHLAIAWGLIENGADLAAPNPAGVTPVSLAVFRGETAIADRLLDVGAPPEGLTPHSDKLPPWTTRHGRPVFLPPLLNCLSDPHP